jgi:hypothetical protein
LHQLLLLLLRLLRLHRLLLFASAAAPFAVAFSSADRRRWLHRCCCYCVGFRCIGFVVASAAAAAIALASAASAFVVASFAATANGVAST